MSFINCIQVIFFSLFNQTNILSSAQYMPGTELCVGLPTEATHT